MDIIQDGGEEGIGEVEIPTESPVGSYEDSFSYPAQYGKERLNTAVDVISATNYLTSSPSLGILERAVEGNEDEQGEEKGLFEGGMGIKEKKGKVKKEGEKEEGKEKVPESRSIDTSSLAQSGMESSEKAGLTEGEDPSESSNPSSSSFPINPLAPSSSSPAVLASINPLGSSSTVTKKKEKIAAELGELAVYCISLPFKDFETSSRLPSDWYISSLSEGTSRDLARSFPEQYRKHTSRHLIRVYPSGTRLGSSNYDPTIHWLAGAQVVALNWQTFGEYFLSPPWPY